MRKKKGKKESCRESAAGFMINLTTGMYCHFRNIAHDNILTLTSSLGQE
jgi:hypothetical protein